MLDSMVQRSIRATGQFRIGGCPAARNYEDLFELRLSVTQVEVVQADLVSPLLTRLQHAVDILVFNPPYVPTPDEEVAKGGIAAAWAGGNCGRVVIDRVLPLVANLLRKGGHFFMVMVPENKPEEILAILSKNGVHGSIVLSRRADEELLHILHVIKD